MAPPPSPRDAELRQLLQGTFQLTGLVHAEGSVRTYSALQEATNNEVFLIVNAKSGPSPNSTTAVYLSMLAEFVSTQIGSVGHLEIHRVPDLTFIVYDRPRGTPLSTLIQQAPGNLPIDLVERLAPALWRPLGMRNKLFSPAVASEHYWVDDDGSAQHVSFEHGFATFHALGGWAGLAHLPPEALQGVAAFPAGAEEDPEVFQQHTSATPFNVETAHGYEFGQLLLQLLLSGSGQTSRTQPPTSLAIRELRPDCPVALAELVAGLILPDPLERAPFVHEVIERWTPTSDDESPPHAAALRPLDPTIADTLTAREHQILKLLATGLTNLEISDSLTISHHTADRHVQNIYRKLGVNRRVDATALAVRHGLID